MASVVVGISHGLEKETPTAHRFWWHL